MLRRIVSVSLILHFSLSTTWCDDCIIKTDAQWQHLEKRLTTSERFGSKLMLIGTVMFKKKSTEQIGIEHLQFAWQGEPIPHLSASLYVKKNNKFMPLEENLICDGSWNAPKQLITFRFNKPYYLSAHTQFYLVLNLPCELEETIKVGTFTLKKNSLPDIIQSCLNEQACKLPMSQQQCESRTSR